MTHEQKFLNEVEGEERDALLKQYIARWKVNILIVLAKEDLVTYDKLKAQLEEVPEVFLYRCLRELVAHDVIERMEERGTHKKLGYGLTEIGESLRPALLEMGKGES